ncbi:PadR family transcriptional regulator [Cryobacterium psychrophilum]|uniref:PadR family transcriptional regulator n=1 Tax=Cryobacterium psychrophilum TaxID=41988 RepID=A0A4Y8KIT1_9MICO|nr:PadR family transcriptional regulator [Cryobacterium psychrophilum]TDW30016.1 DNA-binding PadR family transcriptional regulator [Cryobacterium psychrophilum]TFD75537.1 PadR family transcriptional regulator [Cryobacterium psychrophilum]
MTPVFAHGSLRLYLLSLLDERPRHGYELIQALRERFGGTYSPSAGTIYPRLAKLEEEGLVTKAADGRKTVYEITPAGRAELAAREGELGAIEDEVTDSVRRLATEVRSGVNAAMRSLRADLASAARQARTEFTGNGAARAESETTEAHTEPSEARPHSDAASPDNAGSSTTARADSNRALHEAEMVLNEFRQQLRADLRTQAYRSRVPADTVSDLRRQLADVRASILASLDKSL